MIAVVTRVCSAAVQVNHQTVAAIDQGLLALVAVHRSDSIQRVRWMAGKLLGLRLFPSPADPEKAFDRDVVQIGGSILLVSNFTVAARTTKGRRPSLDPAASQEQARPLFDQLVETIRAGGAAVQTGCFGADMLVSSINDGPVTFLLDSNASE
jgi:D-aminoacyl-tRNA deacylase